MKRMLAIALAAIGWATDAVAHECVASMPPPPDGWKELPFRVATAGAIKLFGRVVCTACDPLLDFVVAAGPVHAAAPSEPNGHAWSQQVMSTPNWRQSVLDQVVTSTRHLYPECTVSGQMRGTASVSSLGLVVVDMSVACPGDHNQRDTEYIGYDGSCLFHGSVKWVGGGTLDPEAEKRVSEVLETVTFGRR